MVTTRTRQQSEQTGKSHSTPNKKSTPKKAAVASKQAKHSAVTPTDADWIAQANNAFVHSTDLSARYKHASRLTKSHEIVRNELMINFFDYIEVHQASNIGSSLVERVWHAGFSGLVPKLIIMLGGTVPSLEYRTLASGVLARWMLAAQKIVATFTNQTPK